MAACLAIATLANTVGMLELGMYAHASPSAHAQLRTSIDDTTTVTAIVVCRGTATVPAGLSCRCRSHCHTCHGRQGPAALELPPGGSFWEPAEGACTVCKNLHALLAGVCVSSDTCTAGGCIIKGAGVFRRKCVCPTATTTPRSTAVATTPNLQASLNVAAAALGTTHAQLQDAAQPAVVAAEVHRPEMAAARCVGTRDTMGAPCKCRLASCHTCETRLRPGAALAPGPWHTDVCLVCKHSQYLLWGQCITDRECRSLGCTSKGSGRFHRRCVCPPIPSPAPVAATTIPRNSQSPGSGLGSAKATSTHAQGASAAMLIVFIMQNGAQGDVVLTAAQAKHVQRGHCLGVELRVAIPTPFEEEPRAEGEIWLWHSVHAALEACGRAYALQRRAYVRPCDTCTCVHINDSSGIDSACVVLWYGTAEVCERECAVNVHACMCMPREAAA